jgi:CheY-like chemotaxis protein
MKKILVVDDEFDIREGIQMILEETGYEVIMANNGYEGLKALDMNKPDLIISDVMMPGLNGIEFWKRVSESSKFRDIPFLLMSAGNIDLKSFGVTGEIPLIKKPFNIDKILNTIEQMMSS